MIVEKHKKIDSRVSAKESGYPYRVTLPWQSQSGPWWNEACADVIEVFGLPGDRYFSRPDINYMDFYFKSEKDAALCKILLSEKIS
jgi:hypothetical protein